MNHLNEQLLKGVGELIEEEWPKNEQHILKYDQQLKSSLWLGRKLTGNNERLTLQDAKNRIQDLVRQEFKELRRRSKQIENLYNFGYKIEKIGYDISSYQSLLLSFIPPDSPFIKIKLEAISVYIPKIILINRSLYFKHLFSSGFKESYYSEIELKEGFDNRDSFKENEDFSINLSEKTNPQLSEMKETVHLFLTFLEKGQIDFFHYYHSSQIQKILNLLQIADKYQVEALLYQCQNWIINNQMLLSKCFTDLQSIMDLYQLPLMQEKLLDRAASNYLSHTPYKKESEDILRKWGKHLNAVFISSQSDLKDIKFVLENCPHLEICTLSDTYSSKSLNLMQVVIQHLNKSLKKLTISDIYFDDLDEFLMNFPKLEELSLSINRPFSEDFFKSLTQFTQLKRLELSISLLKDEFVMELSHLHTLVSLHLKHCDFLTDMSILHLVQELPQLQELTIENGIKLTDEAFIAIASHLTNLRFLNLTGSRNLTNKTLLAISKHLLQLNTLRLSNCSYIEDEGVSRLINLKELEELNLNFCSLLTDFSVKQIAYQSKNLIKLTLNNCFLVTDSAIREIAKHLTHLQHLSLINCQWKPETIHFLQENLKQLHLIKDLPSKSMLALSAC
jgi:hypothetical protein